MFKFYDVLHTILYVPARPQYILKLGACSYLCFREFFMFILLSLCRFLAYSLKNRTKRSYLAISIEYRDIKADCKEYICIYISGCIICIKSEKITFAQIYKKIYSYIVMYITYPKYKHDKNEYSVPIQGKISD